MTARAERSPELVKAVDERSTIRCVSGKKASVRFEGWADATGTIVRYNMAFIQHLLCQVDHGRLLGYDNAHGSHERHFMGKVTIVPFSSFEETLERFLSEVDEIKANA